MTEPVKYLKIIGDILSTYQKQLLRLFKKYPQEQHLQFKKSFITQFNQMKETETHKSIEDEMSIVCLQMYNHLEQPIRLNKTSIETRKNLISQGGNRGFRMTAGFNKKYENSDPIEEQELDCIVNNFNIQEQIMPKMRMKWKNAYEPQRKVQNKDHSSIGNNNIDLLSYAIPEIQNSIRRLSLQRSPKTVQQRQLSIYRTLDSRSMKKKYIPRLF